MQLITKEVTKKGEPLVYTYTTLSNVNKMLDNDITTCYSYSVSSTNYIGLNNFNFKIPQSATINNIAFSLTADSTKKYTYVRRFICTNLTTDNAYDEPSPVLAEKYVINTSDTISEPTEFTDEYSSDEFQTLITNAGLNTNVINFLNNDIDLYFIIAFTLFRSHLLQIYDNKIVVNYTAPHYTINVISTGGAGCRFGTL